MGVLRRIFYLERLPWNLFVLVTCYWLLAFCVAYFVELYDKGNAWWNLDVLCVPGRYMGLIVFRLCEVVLNTNYGHLLGDGLWKFQLALFLAAFCLGGAAWAVAKGLVKLLKTKKG